MANFTSAFKALSHGSLNWDTQLDADLGALETLLNAPAGITGGDWNTVVDPGGFFGSSMANSPDGTTASFGVWVIRRGATFTAQLAIRLDATVGAMYRRVQNAGTWSAWVRINDASQDTGWVTSGTGITAATGWTLTSSKYRNNNGVVSLYLLLTRTGAALTGSTAGLIAATAAAVLPAGLVPAQANGLVSAVGSQSTVAASGFVASGTGNVTITNVTPGQSIATTSGVLELVGTYLL